MLISGLLIAVGGVTLSPTLDISPTARATISTSLLILGAVGMALKEAAGDQTPADLTQTLNDFITNLSKILGVPQGSTTTSTSTSTPTPSVTTYGPWTALTTTGVTTYGPAGTTIWVRNVYLNGVFQSQQISQTQPTS